MLDVLRRKKRSWIITILLGLIIVVFVAFYGGGKQQGSSAISVAQINGESISQREFMMHYQRALERYREMFKVALTPEIVKSLNIKGTLLEELIESHLMLQEAERLGLTATDDELMNMIAQVPDFQVNGRFNKERYIQLLRANRLTPAQFEEEQRKQLTNQRLLSILFDAVHISDTELRERYRFDNEKINLQFVRILASDYVSQIKVTDEEITKFYERNKESLKEPLKVKVEYVAYPFEQFSRAVEVTDKEIEEYYQTNKATKFSSPRQANVRYILVGLNQPADAKQKETAQSRAQQILSQARSGKDFSQLAKQESADPSAAKGGEIGWLTQGQMPTELDKQIFSLKKGEISAPIETPAGFAIVKIDDFKEEKVQSLQEAKPEIVRTVKLEKGKREAAKLADRDREKAVSTDLSKLAQESGVTTKETRLFSAGEVLPEIGAVQEFYKTALSLGTKEISPVIEGPSAYYVLKVTERKEPVIPPLETARGNIEKNLRDSKAYELALQKANTLLDQLKKEKDLSKIARQNNLKVEETGWFSRTGQQLPKVGELQGVSAASLTISAQNPVAERVFTQKDSALLFAFRDSQSADMEQFEKEKTNYMQQSLSESRQRILQKFKDDLKAKAKIEVHSGALEET